MKCIAKFLLSIVIAVLFIAFWNLGSTCQQEYEEPVVETLHDKPSTPKAPEGFTQMNGFYHSSLSEPNTCATNKYPVGTVVTVWCGIDAERGSSVETTVVSNTVHVNTADTIEFSKDINELFAGETMAYTVWVKEV